MAINHLFPCVQRPFGSNAHASRLLTENNVAGIIRTITDRDSFVISKDSSGNVKCVIHGYYFDLSGVSASATHAYIFVNDTTKELYWDNDDTVRFTSASKTGHTEYSVDLTSLVKFNLTSVESDPITKISGGTLT